MGDIADLMTDGTLCSHCGVFIDDNEANGFPRLCSSCQDAERTATGLPRRIKGPGRARRGKRDGKKRR